MAAQRFDVVVVGTGPGGYVAAIRCAQLGLSVAAVEDDRPGGVCLNWGCIPTKALLRNAEIVGLFQRAEEFGVTVGTWSADYAQAIQRSRRVADRMAKGVEFLFRKNKITLVPGTGTLKAKNVVEVTGKDGVQTLEAKAIILATGSEPRSLPGVTIDEKQVISSNGAVRTEAKPASLIVIGAGAVGMEFADVYGAYGVAVTVLEALPRVLPVEDEEVSALLGRVFSRRGMTVRTGVRVQKVSPGKAGLAVEIEAEGKTERLEAQQVLMAVGRASKTRGLGLETLGVAAERGLVTVGPTMETSVKGIFAVGDMTGRQMLAHKAMAEGVVAAEAIAGRSPRPVDYDNVPSCTYCRPQVASIGLSEAQAKTNGREIAVGRFPFTANGKAVALGETEGFLKVVADKRTGEILGVHIVGPEATEMIHEFAVGRTLEATLEEIIHTIHA
ncbi:MAG TPA: dihydrolipoyl dehydrogenase, partial [Methylomirabilota bacterium]|nr:dihydrolipoyl dehydrogenase [Methylomirabilota bacterium]